MNLLSFIEELAQDPPLLDAFRQNPQAVLEAQGFSSEEIQFITNTLPPLEKGFHVLAVNDSSTIVYTLTTQKSGPIDLDTVAKGSNYQASLPPETVATVQAYDRRSEPPPCYPATISELTVNYQSTAMNLASGCNLPTDPVLPFEANVALPSPTTLTLYSKVDSCVDPYSETLNGGLFLGLVEGVEVGSGQVFYIKEAQNSLHFAVTVSIAFSVDTKSQC